MPNRQECKITANLLSQLWGGVWWPPSFLCWEGPISAECAIVLSFTYLHKSAKSVNNSEPYACFIVCVSLPRHLVSATCPATCPATCYCVVLTKPDLSTVAFSEGGSSPERRRVRVGLFLRSFSDAGFVWACRCWSLDFKKDLLTEPIDKEMNI